MKRIAYLIVVLCSACCTMQNVPEGRAVAVAPTVKAPPRAKPVDLQPSKDAARAVGESSLQLKGRIQAMREANYLLSRDLDRALQVGSASTRELTAMKAKAIEQEDRIEEMEAINRDLTARAEELRLSLDVAYAAAEGQKQNIETLYGQLDDANGKITALTLESQRIEGELDRAREKLAAVESEFETVIGIKNSWIFWLVIYGLGATGVIVFIVCLVGYVRSNPMSRLTGMAGRLVLR